MAEVNDLDLHVIFDEISEVIIVELGLKYFPWLSDLWQRWEVEHYVIRFHIPMYYFHVLQLNKCIANLLDDKVGFLL